MASHSESVSFVCWPSAGALVEIIAGVSENFIAEPTTLSWPELGWVIEGNISRTWDCAPFTTSSKRRIGEAGTPAARSLANHSPWFPCGKSQPAKVRGHSCLLRVDCSLRKPDHRPVRDARLPGQKRAITFRCLQRSRFRYPS